MDNTVLKHDLVKGTTETATFGAGASAGEFVFVPRDAAAGEDDGVLMGFVHRPETDTSDLVLLDAATLEPVAEVHLPVRVPHGFHGNWTQAPASELSSTIDALNLLYECGERAGVTVSSCLRSRSACWGGPAVRGVPQPPR